MAGERDHLYNKLKMFVVIFVQPCSKNRIYVMHRDRTTEKAPLQ